MLLCCCDLLVFRLLWTKDQLVVEAAADLTHTHQRNIHAVSGIQNRDPNNQAAKNPTP